MKCLTILISVSIVGLVLTTSSVWAGNKAPKNVYVPAGESKSGNYYAVGETVEVAGSVESDLITAGGNVVVSGAVGGDVIAAGGNIRIVGPVGGNVRVVGGNVEIVGTVARNVTVAAGTLVLKESAIVTGQMTVGTGTLELRGKVQGSLLAASGAVIVAGEVKGPVKIYLDKEGSLDIRETAITGNSFDYYGLKPVQITDGAQLAQAPQQHELAYKPSHQGWWWRYLISLFSALVLGMVLAYLIPNKVKEVVEEATSRPLPSLGWGALWAFAVPVVIIFLAITIIGLPLAAVMLAIYVIGLVLSPVFAGAAVGSYIGSRLGDSWFSKQSFILTVLMGILIYRLIVFVPVVGGLIGFFGALWAWGAILQVQQRLLKTFK